MYYVRRRKAAAQQHLTVRTVLVLLILVLILVVLLVLILVLVFFLVLHDAPQIIILFSAGELQEHYLQKDTLLLRKHIFFFNGFLNTGKRDGKKGSKRT